MKHGHLNPLLTDPWMTTFFGACLILLIACVAWLVHQKTIATDGLTPMERNHLSYQEREILSMLRQHGGPIRQDQLVEGLPGDFEDLAVVILGIENKGYIKREWKSELGTYLLRTPGQEAMNG